MSTYTHLNQKKAMHPVMNNLTDVPKVTPTITIAIKDSRVTAVEIPPELGEVEIEILDYDIVGSRPQSDLERDELGNLLFRYAY
jgi:hypothetical protein